MAQPPEVPHTPGMKAVGAFTTPLEMGACGNLLKVFARAYPDARLAPAANGWTYIVSPDPDAQKESPAES